MTFKKTLVFFLGLLVGSLTSCNDDPEIDPEVWSLNMGEYFGTSYPLSGSTFKAVLLNDEYILVDEYSQAGGHLVEIDFKKGEFVKSTLKNFNLWDMRRRGDDILIASASDIHYKMGIYNSEALKVDFFSEAERINLNDPQGSNAWTVSDYYMYTYNPNINSLDESEVYIAKWNFDGSLVWRKEVSPSNEFKIAGIPIVHDDYILFLSVSDSDKQNEKWGIGKLLSNGDLVWHRQFDKENGLWQLAEDSFGNIFAMNATMIRKLNSIGAIIWSKPLIAYVDGYVWSQSISTTDGGLVFIAEAVDRSDFYTMIKINSTGNRVLELSDVNGIGVTLVELPGGDILTTSLDGYINRYTIR